jgi:hypothetical protein
VGGSGVCMGGFLIYQKCIKTMSVRGYYMLMKNLKSKIKGGAR